MTLNNTVVPGERIEQAVLLTADEFGNLKFHSGRSSWGGTRKPPRAFTEQGVAMLSSVLRSRRAARTSSNVQSRQYSIPKEVTRSQPSLPLGIGYSWDWILEIDAASASEAERPRDGGLSFVERQERDA
jgi:hypothetical protein